MTQCTGTTQIGGTNNISGISLTPIGTHRIQVAPCGEQILPQIVCSNWFQYWLLWWDRFADQFSVHGKHRGLFVPGG